MAHFALQIDFSLIVKTYRDVADVLRRTADEMEEAGGDIEIPVGDGSTITAAYGKSDLDSPRVIPVGKWKVMADGK